jgi:hypothetical protein
MYHDVYDFVVLLPFFVQALRERNLGRSALFFALGIGLSEWGWGGEEEWSRALRWLGRGAAAGLFGLSFLRMYYAGRRQYERSVQSRYDGAM